LPGAYRDGSIREIVLRLSDHGREDRLGCRRRRLPVQTVAKGQEFVLEAARVTRESARLDYAQWIAHDEFVGLSQDVSVVRGLIDCVRSFPTGESTLNMGKGDFRQKSSAVSIDHDVDDDRHKEQPRSSDCPALPERSQLIGPMDADAQIFGCSCPHSRCFALERLCGQIHARKSSSSTCHSDLDEAHAGAKKIGLRERQGNLRARSRPHLGFIIYRPLELSFHSL
jgi:hypothetical protein